MADNNSNSIKEYDEDEAINYILSNLPDEVSKKYDGNDILLLIDSIFDFYESKGFFNIDDNIDSDDDFDKSELISYVAKSLKKDKDNKIESSDVANIVELELEYEDSINDF